MAHWLLGWLPHRFAAEHGLSAEQLLSSMGIGVGGTVTTPFTYSAASASDPMLRTPRLAPGATLGDDKKAAALRLQQSASDQLLGPAGALSLFASCLCDSVSRPASAVRLEAPCWMRLRTSHPQSCARCLSCADYAALAAGEEADAKRHHLLEAAQVIGC
jgi:hypothetical protein